ncbi:acetyltransferase [Vibrio cholerae]|nr:acetyltransferase [Vibrio cholerae]EGR4196132.1 acetyltransferase [Vibrio cholerae]MVB40772.1 acetyltransferase [Vibrio cholerae]MVB63190.1 acetyltransferase [Vibrio cholerae]QBJ30736.1 acetyltransferase [Vibrio cholerae]
MQLLFLSLAVMRCQPLRRALAVFRNTPNPREGKCTN